MQPPRLRIAARGYSAVAKPLLFRLDAERAHRLTVASASTFGRLAAGRFAVRALQGRSSSAGVDLWGVHFGNRLGLAAGMDKNGQAIPMWSALGFGHAEVGTVTSVAQPGNPAPRLVRLPRSGALINRMGFNNDGAQALAAQVRADRERGLIDIPVGVSLGKSKVTPLDEATEDYLSSLRAVNDIADYIAINVSSPNTPGLRSLQDADLLRELLSTLVREAHGTPVLVKLAPDLSDPAIDEALQVATDVGISGIIAGNTTIARDLIDPSEREQSRQPGGLSGAPLTLRSRAMVARIVAGSTFPVIGVGGIMTVDDARAMLDVGAELVQMYTGAVYGGPGLVNGIRAL